MAIFTAILIGAGLIWGAFAEVPTGEVRAQGGPQRSWAGTVPAPEFPAGLDWLHVTRPLTWDDMRGKAVLLDFWTYGCINCLHNLPGLLRLQEEFQDELVIIGIHSAKFPHEGVTAHIRNTARRYELDYPMVNDRDFLLFRMWGARAWPTLVLIDPRGYVVGAHSGEGVYELLQPVLTELVAEFDALGLIDRTPLDVLRGRSQRPMTELSFPGKVRADPARGRLFVADTHHHRIAVVDERTGEIVQVIGSGRPGFADGPIETAQFTRPQGMALSADGAVLYVADSGNHAIRAVHLDEQSVVTVTGSGRQARTYFPIAGVAPDVELNSPWDVELDGQRLYVGMAGSHQIWTIDLTSGRVELLAGSGREGTADGVPVLAELAQPMGIALDRENHRLYFVDTEGSSVRWIGLAAAEQHVGTLAGSGRTLFDFGDEDGPGRGARFQHPRGIVLYGGTLYVADTYNGKIKRIDPRTTEVETLWGDGHGWLDGANPRFYEPGGIDAAEGKLYVADTHNHAIRIIDLAEGQTDTLVVWSGERQRRADPAGDPFHRVEQAPPAHVRPGIVRVTLTVDLPPGYMVNDTAPSRVDWRGDGAPFADTAAEDRVASWPELTFPVSWSAPLSAGEGTLHVDLDLYYCREDQRGLCFIESVTVEVPVSASEGGEDRLDVHYAIPLPEEEPIAVGASPR